MGKGKRLEEKHLGIIVISLVPEAEITDNKEIEKQIKEESSIPFLAEVEKVTIEKVENPHKQLRGHGFSKKTARNIVSFYERQGMPKQSYACRHCGYVLPKKDATISGHDSQSSLRHIHCPRCGKIITHSP